MNLVENVLNVAATVGEATLIIVGIVTNMKCMNRVNSFIMEIN